MNGPATQAPDKEDQAAVAALRARGIQVADIQALARDQSPFARRTTPSSWSLAPGVTLTARTAELGEGCFTNVFTLAVNLDQAQCRAVSSPAGFHLRDLVRGDAVAAGSGSFSYISDDPAYQPAEPCLDLAIRDGQVASLPTITKPALLIHRGRPLVRTLAATGTLTIAGRTHIWTGSKERHPPSQSGHLTVFGAANCRVRYRDDPRTGFLRDVDPATNTTPRDPDALDCTVTSTGTGLRVAAVHPGGGADLFAGAFILRAHRPWPTHLIVGALVGVTSVDTHHVRDLESALSLGPSAAEASAGRTRAWDQSLGTSPFRPASRYPRTLLALHDDHLQLTVFDGAPLTSTFQGTTTHETAELCAQAGLDPSQVFHLDGGQTSKIAYTRHHQEPDVVGSLHYLQWPATADAPFRWRGLEGRLLRSALLITAPKETR
ncbi:hypothetical protein J7I98_14085 [Streptomyces sp. ISL-98]|uniref:phosphodiester glycosidase family protein n=1 Tax=Streptomyces sp. ISL-98 TaxID=2819192 RepID=UPI001BE8DA5B|nr:phosphodiester glycosidase family protein [Streptomyces sp. ISL-98]MBT2506998.1 hypothetical protein [Streptomyces sp. ISL-98]